VTALVAAGKAGYDRFVDTNGVACIDMAGMDAMGVHYVRSALVGDGKLDPQTPEALVYAPDAHGGLHLAAEEYTVLQAAGDAQHTAPPSLFGQQLSLTASPNRYGLPPFCSLHAWTWMNNPAGTFAMWNPNVSCPAAGGHSSRLGPS
jgi:hypothetical protein